MPRAKPTQRNFNQPQAGLIPPRTSQGHSQVDSIEKLQSDLRRQPGDPELHFSLAQTLLRSGRKRQAE
jgi:thioredoxin-like negative regulator of GroEL